MEAEPFGAGQPAWLQHVVWGLAQPPVLAVLVASCALGLALALRAGELRVAPDVGTRLFLAIGAFILVMALAVPGLSGGPAVDGLLHDTHYVSLDMRAWLATACIALAFAGIYRGFRGLVGVAYRRWLALLHGGLFAAGIALQGLAWLGRGRAGMPRRYAGADGTGQGLEALQLAAGAGYIVTMLSCVVFAICLVEAITRRIHTGRDPD